MSTSPYLTLSLTTFFSHQVIVRNDFTGSVSVFKCNAWLTPGDLVKELPAITDGEKKVESKFRGHGEKFRNLFLIL